MKLPVASATYDQSRENLRNQMLEIADRMNVKRSETIEVRDPQLLVLVSPNGTKWKITVSNAGAITATAL